MLKFALISITLFLMLTTTAYAEPPKSKDILEWETKGKVFQDWYQNDPDGCNKVFNALWLDSKKGDLNARLYLLGQMTIMHGPDMNLPSTSTDSYTRTRQYIIMAAHSIGSKLDNAGADDKVYYTDTILSMGNISAKSGFKKCLQKTRSHECVNLAVKNGDIPSFENFAKEIDLFINAGYKPTCPGNDFHKAEIEHEKKNNINLNLYNHKTN